MPTVEAVYLNGTPLFLEDCDTCGDVMAKIAIRCNRFATDIVVVDPTSGKKMNVDKDMELEKVEFVLLNEEDTKVDIETCIINLFLHAAQSDLSTCSKLCEKLRWLDLDFYPSDTGRALYEMLKRKNSKWKAITTLTRLSDGIMDYPFYFACIKGDAAVVQMLLSARVDANCGDSVNGPALLGALYRGRDEIVEILLSAGADVNDSRWFRITPLTMATERGNAKMVQLLVSAGADLDLRDREGFTALMRACDYGYPEIVHMLLSAGAKVDPEIPEGADWKNTDTALRRASNHGHTEIVQMLLSVRAVEDCLSDVV